MVDIGSLYTFVEVAIYEATTLPTRITSVDVAPNFYYASVLLLNSFTWLYVKRSICGLRIRTVPTPIHRSPLPLVSLLSVAPIQQLEFQKPSDIKASMF